MNWLPFALAGSIAQLIDGTVGMGFGLTSSTFILALGASAASASAAVHLAELGTTLASGVAHWHRENVDVEILKHLAIPGGIGAFLGASFLSRIDLSSAKVFISTILLFLGFLLLYRTLFRSEHGGEFKTNSPSYLRFLGFGGGFLDAAGGGGWGPVVTPTLLTTTSTDTKKVIGTVSASEFIVACSASLGFLLSLSKLDMNWSAVVGLAIGGVLMAPIAAKAVNIASAKVLGVIVGIAIVIINAARLLGL